MLMGQLPPHIPCSGSEACTPPFPGSGPSRKREGTLSFTFTPPLGPARRCSRNSVTGFRGGETEAQRGHACTTVGWTALLPCPLSHTPEKLLPCAKGNMVKSAKGTLINRQTKEATPVAEDSTVEQLPAGTAQSSGREPAQRPASLLPYVRPSEKSKSRLDPRGRTSLIKVKSGRLGGAVS